MKKYLIIMVILSLSLISAEELEDEINATNKLEIINAEKEKKVIIEQVNKENSKKLLNVKEINPHEYNSFKIEVNVEDKTMVFYGINGEQKEKLHLFVVGTPKKTIKYPKGLGKVLRVELDPWWYPTNKTIEEFKKKKGINLPSAIPPGHKQNYMGSFKIILSNSTKEGGAVYRIHGNVDPKSIGKRSSGGCVRMYNGEGREFAVLVKQILKSGKNISVIYY